MTGILLELHFLPSIQYLSKWLCFEQVIIEQQEHYIKGSYRNRAHLIGSNAPIRLSVPLQKGKNEQLSIREVRIANEQPWQKAMIRTIQSAYGKAPFYEFYAPPLLEILEQAHSFLFDLNRALLEEILDLLELDIPLSYTDTFQTSPPKDVLDFRNHIHPKTHRRQPDPWFQIVEYPQVFQEKHGFLPNLSILDVLFCAGPQTIEILAKSGTGFDHN
jgi:hypothetical protein